MSTSRDSTVSKDGLFGHSKQTSEVSEQSLLMQMLLNEWNTQKEVLRNQEEKCQSIINDFLRTPEAEQIAAADDLKKLTILNDYKSLLQRFDEKADSTNMLLKRFNVTIQSVVLHEDRPTFWIAHGYNEKNQYDPYRSHPEKILKMIQVDLKFISEELKQIFEKKTISLNETYREKILDLQRKTNQVQMGNQTDRPRYNGCRIL